MTNISKKSLSKEKEEGLFKQLAKVFTHQNDQIVEGVLSELLGYEERIMIAKRFAAILLIHHKQSPYFIAHTLALSPTTVGTLLDRYERGEFSHLVTLYKKPTPALFEIFETIDSMLHLGGLLPRYKAYTKKSLKL